MKSKFHMLSGAALTVLALAPGVTAHAQAANSLGDVVVTATKTGATNLQKTPLSVDVIGSADLKKEGVESFRDLQMELPSVKLLTNGTNPRVYIRGVGGFNSNDGEVSLYVDGVFISRPTEVTQTPFNDLDRVEVLEGPQGTLFGRNSVGGAINFISKVPSDHFTFNNTLSVGNYALIDEEASVSGPIADNMQASLAVTKFQHNGYEHNLDPGIGDGDNANRFGARGQLRWEITPDITNTVRADYSYTHENWMTGQNPLADVSSGKAVGITAGCTTPYTGAASGAGSVCGFNYAPLFESHIGDLRNIDYGRLPLNNEITYGVNDEFDWKINDHLTLKSVTAGRTDNSSQDQGNPTEVITTAYGPQLFYEYEITQEFNLIHQYGPLSGVAGVYYYLDNDHYLAAGPNPGGNVKIPNPSAGYVTGQDTKDPTTSRAIFLEESYHITPTLKVTAGARYTEDSKTFNSYNYSQVYDPGNVGCTNCNGTYPSWISPQPGNFNTDLTYLAHSTTPKLAVDWQATPDMMFYASATSGYKSGGFNETSRWCLSPAGVPTATCPALAGNAPYPAVVNVPPPLGTLYGPETMWAYETGVRSDWFDHTLRVNLSFFRYDWSGLQFSASIAPQTVVTSNAGDARTYGMEAAVTYKPAPGLTIDLHATVLDAKYISFDAYSAPTNLRPYLPKTTLNSAGQPIGKGLYTDVNGNSNLYNASGNTLAEAPPVSLSLAVQKDFDLANGADLFVRGEYEYQGQVFFDPTNAVVDSQAAYSIVNGSIGYSPAHSHWTVSVWGKNMADTRYIVGAQSGGGCLCAAIGDPRTFGVRLNYTY
jgi:iron complex outermembrane receptor protein